MFSIWESLCYLNKTFFEVMIHYHLDTLPSREGKLLVPKLLVISHKVTTDK